MNLLRHLVVAFFLSQAILWGGVIGYMVVEDYDFFQALYMTVISVTTVGYGEVFGLSRAGRIFTVFLIMVSFGVIFYIATAFTQALIAGQIRAFFGRQKMERAIKKLRGHFILCGFGRIGSVVAKELEKEGVPFVVVERDPTVVKSVEEQGYLYVEGDATTDETLRKAGIERARGLVATVASDADNLYITLSARQLNPRLFILTRAESPDAERNLKAAGADRVVSPYLMGALRMANALLRPHVVDFIELAVHRRHLELQMEEIRVEDDRYFAGKPLKECGLRERFGVIVVATRKATGEAFFNPSPETTIEKGDVLIVLGESKGLKELEKVVKFQEAKR
ncbi:MAG: potassium channel protein [Deltaproteobacteria bacterium]|nr:MAG: potassium channel protein [Deltaproteobacteria bacterium]HEX16300.1 potassium channel protein [Deltaproteobacteria bacterium]